MKRIVVSFKSVGGEMPLACSVCRRSSIVLVLPP